MENDVITFLVVIGGFGGFSGLIVSIILAHRRQAALLDAVFEVQSKLVEKLSSDSELRAYLDARGITAIADAMRPRSADLHYRLIAFVMAGCVVIVMGCGLFLTAAVHDAGSARQTLFLLATIVMSGGIGLLVSAAVGRTLIDSQKQPTQAHRE